MNVSPSRRFSHVRRQAMIYQFSHLISTTDKIAQRAAPSRSVHLRNHNLERMFRQQDFFYNYLTDNRGREREASWINEIIGFQ